MKSEHSSSLEPARLLSLDALRGLDMFLLVGLGPILGAVAGMSDNAFTRTLAIQIRHPDWQGFTLWDLIFPLFIFIVGVALPFSLAKRLERDGKKAVYRHIVIRAAILSILGLVFWGTPGGAHPDWGYYSVLYRIAVSYLFAALIVLNFQPRAQVLWALGIIAGYWILMHTIPVPGFGAGDFTREGNLNTFIAEWISENISPRFKHVFSLTLAPSIANALLGALAGQWLRSSATPQRKTLCLLLAGSALIALSFAVAPTFPLNKKLASTSFTLLTCGLSASLLALFYWIIDLRGYRRWAFFFVVVGMNPLTIYLVNRYVSFSKLAGVFVGDLSPILGTTYPLLLTSVAAAFQWLLLFYLYRKKIFIRV